MSWTLVAVPERGRSPLALPGGQRVGRGRAGRPSLTRPWATSMRNPSTPRSSQNRRIVVELRADLRVLPVEVGLLGGEQVEVPLARRADAGPRRAAEDGQPVVRRLAAVRAPPGAEDVALARSGCPARPPAPPGTTRARSLVWFGTMSTMTRSPSAWASADQLVEVRQRAEDRVDVAVVGDVVPSVGHRRGVERRDPQRVDAEVAEVGQPGADAGRGRRPRHRRCRRRRGRRPGR